MYCIILLCYAEFWCIVLFGCVWPSFGVLNYTSVMCRYLVSCCGCVARRYWCFALYGFVVRRHWCFVLYGCVLPSYWYFVLYGCVVRVYWCFVLYGCVARFYWCIEIYGCVVGHYWFCIIRLYCEALLFCIIR